MKSLFINKIFGFARVNSLNATRKKDSVYVLKSKSSPAPIPELKKYSNIIPDCAFLYSRIKIGKKNDKNFHANIVTFFDKDKKVLKKIFTETGRKPKIREYSRSSVSKPDCENITERRNITTRVYNKLLQKWEIVQDENQYIQSQSDKCSHNKGFAKKIHINKNKFVYSDDELKVHSTITEYPLTLGFEDKDAKKILSAELSVKKNIPETTQILPETNVEFLKEDEFLPYRLLVGKQKQTSLTQYSLNERGLGNVGIGIYYLKNKVPQNAEGLFDHIDGDILYKGVSKQHPVKIAAHESEHAYEYSLIGGLGKLNTPYGIKCQKKLPPITDVKKMQEGYSYLIASETYPKLSVTEDLAKNKEYLDNELEKKAREKAEEVFKVYNKGRLALSKIFKYAIDETCF